MADLTQEQLDSVLNPMKALIDVKVAEAVTASPEPMYTQTQLNDAVTAAVTQTKADLKAAFATIDATEDGAIAALFN